MLSIHQLTLHHFRNHAHFELHTGGQNIILTGANGAGKTNILEAVSLLSAGKGLRKAPLAQMRCQQGDASWVVAASVRGLQGSVHVGTALDAGTASSRERRLIKIDGELAKSQTALAEHLAIVWHTPQMDGLFLASDGERRRYLDRLIFSFDSAHVARVSHYEHAMRERNRLLAQHGARSDGAWLSALEEQMAQGSISIAAARLSLIERLTQAIAAAQHPFPRAQLAMQGLPESLLLEQGASASDAEAQLRAQLAASRPRDAAAGRALVGAHRSMLLVRHLGKNIAADQCSTGEQKALLLSILLAHAAARRDWLGAAPIILLDETVAHLDEARRKALSVALAALQTQVWMSGTDVADFVDFEVGSQKVQLSS